MILMKNKENLSPLDISIENDSPRCTELFIHYVTQLHEGSYSELIFRRFNQLLSMNIQSFYEYLESCFFQTLQMKNIKYLPLKNNRELWLGAHSSCLLDEIFMSKHTFNGEERRRKRQQHLQQKIKEEQVWAKLIQKHKPVIEKFINSSNTLCFIYFFDTLTIENRLHKSSLAFSFQKNGSRGVKLMRKSTIGQNDKLESTKVNKHPQTFKPKLNSNSFNYEFSESANENEMFEFSDEEGDESEYDQNENDEEDESGDNESEQEDSKSETPVSHSVFYTENYEEDISNLFSSINENYYQSDSSHLSANVRSTIHPLKTIAKMPQQECKFLFYHIL